MSHALHKAPKSASRAGVFGVLGAFASHGGETAPRGAHVRSTADEGSASVSRSPLRFNEALFGSASQPVVSPSVRHASRGSAALSLDPDVLRAINSTVPKTRKALRQERKSRARHTQIAVSLSCAALVGTIVSVAAMSDRPDTALASSRGTSAAEHVVKTAVPLSQTAGRDPVASDAGAKGEETTGTNPSSTPGEGQSGKNKVRTEQTSNDGAWNLGQSGLDVRQLSKLTAKNPAVAALLDGDQDVLPSGFQPDHASGDTGNSYEFSQCTWWVYQRRHELGLPVGSNMGNGEAWAASAQRLGYWVDHTARHVGDIMVFAAGQDGSDPICGHVAVIEKINPDGSVETSESGAPMNGKTFSRTFTAAQVSAHAVIHY